MVDTGYIETNTFRIENGNRDLETQPHQRGENNTKPTIGLQCSEKDLQPESSSSALNDDIN